MNQVNYADCVNSYDGADSVLRCRLNGRPRWGNQTDSGQNKLAPSMDRWKERSRTYQGIAAAFASQWGE